MAGLISALLQLMGVSARDVAGRAAGVSVMFVLALAFLLLGVTGLSTAVWLALARVIDPLLAALIIGSVAVIIAAILLLVARSRARMDFLLYGPPKQKPTTQPAPDSLALLLPLALLAVIGLFLSPDKPKE